MRAIALVCPTAYQSFHDVQCVCLVLLLPHIILAQPPVPISILIIITSSSQHFRREIIIITTTAIITITIIT